MGRLTQQEIQAHQSEEKKRIVRVNQEILSFLQTKQQPNSTVSPSYQGTGSCTHAVQPSLVQGQAHNPTQNQVFVPVGGPNHFTRPPTIKPDGLQENTLAAYLHVKKVIAKEMGDAGQSAPPQSRFDNLTERGNAHQGTTAGAEPPRQPGQAQDVAMAGTEEVAITSKPITGGSTYDASRDPRRRRV